MRGLPTPIPNIRPYVSSTSHCEHRSRTPSVHIGAHLAAVYLPCAYRLGLVIYVSASVLLYCNRQVSTCDIEQVKDVSATAALIVHPPSSTVKRGPRRCSILPPGDASQQRMVRRTTTSERRCELYTLGVVVMRAIGGVVRVPTEEHGERLADGGDGVDPDRVGVAIIVAVSSVGAHLRSAKQASSRRHE